LNGLEGTARSVRDKRTDQRDERTVLGDERTGLRGPQKS